jgi:hypothetical protein
MLHFVVFNFHSNPSLTPSFKTTFVEEIKLATNNRRLDFAYCMTRIARHGVYEDSTTGYTESFDLERNLAYNQRIFTFLNSIFDNKPKDFQPKLLAEMMERWFNLNIYPTTAKSFTDVHFYNNCKKTCLALLAIRKFRRSPLNVLDREVIKLIVMNLWTTKFEILTWV